MARGTFALLLSPLVLLALPGCQEEPEAMDVPKAEPTLIWESESEPEATQAEETELEGTWEVTTSMTHGRQDEIDGLHWRFERDAVYCRNNGDENWKMLSRFTVNPATNPAGIDLVGLLGIYVIQDDLLAICFANPRPKVFESSEASQTSFYLFRRVLEESDE